VTENSEDVEPVSRFRRTAGYLGLIDSPPQSDDGLSFRQRVLQSWRRELSHWPFWLWFVVVGTVAGSARWYITILIAVGLGIGLVVLAALWQIRRDRRQAPTSHN
jgi:hypothetical protein